ncbi:MAG: hypothetical protein QOG41_524 [Thermoleophilaceae bacterium]|nr:hypothetical protein [Thermoleophilaceae bacterium]
MRVRAAIAAAAAVAVLAGCGTGTADLLSIDVTSEGIAARKDSIRVTDDGRGTCGGPLTALPSQTVLDARGVKRAMRPLARRGASFLKGGVNVRHYEFRSFDGVVRWDEGAAAPPAIGRATLLALRLGRRLCRGG